MTRCRWWRLLGTLVGFSVAMLVGYWRRFGALEPWSVPLARATAVVGVFFGYPGHPRRLADPIEALRKE